jgi:dephospho-CoA kinase
MKLCGLTGGVGMGKSTTAGFLSQLGAHIVDTDEIAHQLVHPGQPALAEITEQFGAKVIASDGTLDRARLAHIVFNDPVALRKLEDILHPRIRGTWRARVEQWRQENGAVAFVVIPLLFETRAENEFGQIICVACSPESQTERLRLRGWQDDQIHRRIAAQMPIGEKISRSHFVVWTEGSLEVHRRQISEILGKI